MGNLTNFSEAELLRFLLAVPGQTQLANTVTTFVGLFTEAPSETGGGTEVALTDTEATPPGPTGYSRQPATFVIVPGDPTIATNQGTISFTRATANFGTITHVGIFDAVAAGNLLAFSELAMPLDIMTGEQVQFQNGSIQVRAL